MSKFFQALERAEQEGTLRRQHGLQDAVSNDRPSPPISPSLVSPPRRSPRIGSGLGATTLESLVSSPETIEGHLVSLLAPQTFEAEQYRMLSYLVEQLHADAGLSVLAVSSPTVGDGKTTTAINLACALTQLPGARVLLVDLDIRRPCVSANLGIKGGNTRGLVDFVKDPNLGLEAVLRAYPSSKLTLLFAGKIPPTPYDILQSSRLEELIEEARQSYDYVVLDTPPLIPFPDCRLIERFVDGFLVVIGAHKTPRRLVTEAISIIDPEKVIGAVFNSDDHPAFGDYSYYTYGTYHPGKEQSGAFGGLMKNLTTLFRRTPKV